MAPASDTGRPQNSSSEVYNATDELDMMQLSDSMFPTGMFASSGGLELMFERKMITDARQLADLCKDIIERQMGTSDCIALAVAHDAASRHDTDAIIEADAVLCSMKTVPEAREAAIRSGVQLCRCVAAFCTDTGCNGNNDNHNQNSTNNNNGSIITAHLNLIKRKYASGIYPVSLGVCCSALRIRKEAAVQMLLYGFASGMTGAALRLGMIQHIEAQCIIHDLKPAIRQAAAGSVASRGIHEMWQFCPHAEILQMAHARMDTKMFIT